MDEHDEGQQATHEAPPHDAPPDADGSGKVDIEKLAERVYRLMLAEARQARARGAGSPMRERR